MPNDAAALASFKAIIADDVPLPADALIQEYIHQADALICGYIGSQLLPQAARIDNIRAMMAVILYNRRGAEGERKRTEGEVSTWFEETMPDIVRLQLLPFRNARADSLRGDY